jgi:Tfp pilus assembly protein FimV
MKSTTEQTETAAPAAATETKASKKATGGARRANAAPAKAKAGKKATPKKKAPRSARNDAREGSKTATILELLKQPGGVTAKELLKTTNWQPHSLRGFLSGTVGKKMGLTVTSTKGEDGERNYSVKA